MFDWFDQMITNLPVWVIPLIAAVVGIAYVVIYFWSDWVLTFSEKKKDKSQKKKGR